MGAGGGIKIVLDPTPFIKKFRRLTRSQIEPLVAKAVSGVAFEVQNAERADVLSSGFAFAANTANFLSSYRVIRATHYTTVIESHVMPRGSTFGRVGKGERILLDHQLPKAISFQDPSDAERLGIKGGKLAIPAQVHRTGQGKVPARLLPSRIAKKGLRERGRGKKRKGPSGSFPFFDIGGGKIGLFFRDPNQENRLRLGYVLQEQAKLKTGPLNFHGVARAVALTEFPRKMKRAFSRVRG